MVKSKPKRYLWQKGGRWYFRKDCKAKKHRNDTGPLGRKSYQDKPGTNRQPDTLRARAFAAVDHG